MNVRPGNGVAERDEGRAIDETVSAGSGPAGGTSAANGANGPRSSSSLLSGTSVMLLSRVVVAALGWTGTIIIAHHLTKSEFGSFSFIFNLLGLLGLIADFQTSRIVMTEIVDAGDDLDPIVGRFFLFRVALGTVTYAIAVFVMLVGPYSATEVRGAMIGGLSFFIASGLWSLIIVCQAKLWLRSVAIALAVAQAVQLAVTVTLVALHVTRLEAYIVPAVLNDAVALTFLLLALRRVLTVRPRVDLPRWGHWLKEAAPLALGSALGTIYFRIDSLMLTLLLPHERSRIAVATYQIGYKFSDLFGFLAPAMLGAVLPMLVRTYPNRMRDFRRVWRQAFVLIVVFAVFVVAVFAGVAKPVITALYGHRYSDAARPARVLVIGQSLNFFTALTYVTLVASGRRRIYPIATGVGVCVNVGLNCILIPRYTVMGAAITTIVTEVVVIAVLSSALRGLPVRPFPLRPLCVAVISGALALGVYFALAGLGPWPLAAIAAVAGYLGALHALRVDGPGGLRAVVRDSRFRLDDTAPADAAVERATAPDSSPFG